MKPAPRGPVESAPPGVSVRGVRIPFIQRAMLTCQGHTESLFLVDLGVRGAFAERHEPLPVGEPVTLTFTLPGNEIPLKVGARVAWWHPPGGKLVSKVLPAGIGLEFLTWSEEDARRLRRYVEEYLRREPAGRRFHRPRPLAEDGEES